jgi:hypothetical protein
MEPCVDLHSRTPCTEGDGRGQQRIRIQITEISTGGRWTEDRILGTNDRYLVTEDRSLEAEDKTLETKDK